MKIATNNLIIMGIVVLVYIGIDLLLFAGNGNNFLPIFLLQLGFIIMAVSPVGEAILRMLYGGKELTQREADYLMPLFNSVYESVLKTHPEMNKSVKLYIENTMTVNAFALGGRTITITRGAMETLTEDEIKGILAHEFGHLTHGDTILPLVFIVGNVMFLVFMLVVKLVQWVVAVVTASHDILFVGRFINILATALITLCMFIIQALFLVNQRQNEYFADKFAYEIGYGEDLKDALYDLSEVDFSGKESMLDRIKSSHPNIRNRINRLEEML